MTAVLVVVNGTLTVKGCVIKAWSAVVRRECKTCPDQCAYREAKIEWAIQ
jgi:hypothetical protein